MGFELGRERRRALSVPEGDEETASGGEGARRLGQKGSAGGGPALVLDVGDPLGEPDDRLTAGIATEQQCQ